MSMFTPEERASILATSRDHVAGHRIERARNERREEDDASLRRWREQQPNAPRLERERVIDPFDDGESALDRWGRERKALGIIEKRNRETLHYSTREFVPVEPAPVVTKDNGLGDVDLADTFSTIADAFNALSSRIEDLESRMSALETNATTSVNSTKRLTATTAAIESRRERDVKGLKETAAGVRGELDFLRLELRMLQTTLANLAGKKESAAPATVCFYVNAERW